MSDIEQKYTGPKDGNSFLTLEEIHKLMNSSSDTKIEITQNIAKYYAYDDRDESQVKIAEQVFRTLLKDTEVKVRKSLSDSIKNLKDVPHDVVANLARDIEEVSLPVLEFSDVLSDADLVDIISSAESEKKHLAIAGRKVVTEKISEALINTRSEKVVGQLMQNKGAEVSEDSFTKVVKNHSNSELVIGSMVERGSLPVAVFERLTGTVSQELFKKISEKHKGKMTDLEEAISKSRDMATMQVMGLKSSDEEFREFMVLMNSLKISEELMPIAALCTANMNLFEVCVAKRTKVPVLNIRALLKDRSNQGFKAIFGRAGLPMHLYEATVMLLDTVRDFETSNLPQDGSIRLSTKSSNRLIERLLMKAEESGKPEGFEYLLTLIKHGSSLNKD